MEPITITISAHFEHASCTICHL